MARVSSSLRYALLGAAMGLLLPLAATFMEAALHHGGISLGSLEEAQASSPLLWLMTPSRR